MEQGFDELRAGAMQPGSANAFKAPEIPGICTRKLLDFREDPVLGSPPPSKRDQRL